jgi:hypothetical protein
VTLQLEAPVSDPVPGNNNGFANLNVTIPLPIDLLAFDGKNNNCNAISLEWKTESERNNDFIEVQRSTNAKDFEVIGSVKGYNQAGRNSYSFLDNQNLLPNTRYYYRLRQVDFNGDDKVYKIIDVLNECDKLQNNLTVYPNPAVDKVNLAIQGLNDEALELKIFNHVGALVKTLKVSTLKLNELSISDLVPGVYQIKAANQDTNLSAKFIKIE